MNIERSSAVSAGGREGKIVELITHHKRKRRHEVVADARMAEGTVIQSLLPREFRRVYHVHCLPFGGF